MVPHRLVEVHPVEDGGVEAGEELVGDDEDLRVFVGSAERLADGPFLVFGEVPAGQPG